MAYRELKPDEWLEEIRRGLEFRRRFGLEDKWGELESIYYNVHESMANDGPNILLSQGDAMMSLLSVPSPRIKVRAMTPECVLKAPYVESLDNSLLDEMGIGQEVDTSILHAFLFGRGILKFGYDSQWGYDNELDLGGSLKLGLTLSQLNPQGNRQIEHNAKIQPGMPWAAAVDPRDFVVPWGTKDIDTAPWVAVRLCRNIEDLKNDRKYENTRGLTATTSMRDFVESYRVTNKMNLAKMNSQDCEFIEFYEIHDRRTGKILAVTWDHDKYLRNQTNLLQIDNKLPFASIAFTPRTRSFWTTPDAYYLYHVQTELSDVARQRTKQRRLAVLKFLYDSDSLEDTELDKLLSPDVGAAAKVESGRDISKAIIKLENNPNTALITEEETLRANAREQIGFSRNQLGEYTGGRKTATEVSAVDRSSQLRMSRRGLQTKRLYQDAVGLINGIIFKHWTIGRYVEVMGEENAQEFERVSGPQMSGRYKYQIEFVDEGELESRKLQALQLYSMLSQDPSIPRLELQQFLVGQVNDPSFGRLFSASIRTQMQQQEMLAQRGGAGAGGKNGPGGQASPVQQMQLPNGQNGQQDATRLLARRGSSTGAYS